MFELSAKSMKTSAAPYAEIHNPIVVHCTFVTILSRPFARLFFNLAMRIRALFTKSATTLGLVEQAVWRVPFFTE